MGGNGKNPGDRRYGLGQNGGGEGGEKVVRNAVDAFIKGLNRLITLWCRTNSKSQNKP